MIKGFLNTQFRRAVEWCMNQGELGQHYLGIGLAPLNKDYAGEGRFFPSFSTMRKSRMAFQNIRLMQQLVRVINKVDDDADTTPPEKILAAGDVVLGKQPSPFIFKMYKPEYWHVIGKLVDRGLTDWDTRYSFSNLAGLLVKERAFQEKEYLETKSVGSRIKLAEANTKLARVYASSVFQYFTQDERLEKCIEEGLTYESVESLYPNLGQSAYLVQIADDLRDLFTDLEYEIRTGVPTPNYVLAQIHKDGALLDSIGNIHPDIIAFIEINQNNTNQIPFSDLPDFVLESIGRIENDYMEYVQANTTGIGKQTAIAFWTAAIKYGLSSSENANLQEDRAAERKRTEKSLAQIRAEMADNNQQTQLSAAFE